MTKYDSLYKLAEQYQKAKGEPKPRPNTDFGKFSELLKITLAEPVRSALIDMAQEQGGQLQLGNCVVGEDGAQTYGILVNDDTVQFYFADRSGDRIRAMNRRDFRKAVLDHHGFLELSPSKYRRDLQQLLKNAISELRIKVPRLSRTA